MNQIIFNIRAHDKNAHLYDAGHQDIFNPFEQTRLATAVNGVLKKISKEKILALDFGCGTGNITRHLLSANAHVVSADVSQQNLLILEQKLFSFHDSFQTLLIDGDSNKALSFFKFDVIFVYSVLHHIPDYLDALSRLAPLLNTGGFLVIDHEVTPIYWAKQQQYKLQQSCVSDQRKILLKRLRQSFSPSYLKTKLLQLFVYKYYQPEGDIHVWPHDHISWDLIESTLVTEGLEPIDYQDYLVYNPIYDEKRYLSLIETDYIPDMRIMTFQKKANYQ